LRRLVSYPMPGTESESVILQIARTSSPFAKQHLDSAEEEI